MSNMSPALTHRGKNVTARKMVKRILGNWQLYLFLLPTLAYFLIFRYYPMYGLQIAFRNYKAVKGIWGSPWVGFQNFERFFSAADFSQLLKNTLAVSVGNLLVSFPVPIILALLLNQLPSKGYKKIVQTVIYAPHFISTVVMVGIIFLFFSPSSGIVNHVIVALGGQAIHFTAEASMFRPLYIGSDIWQSAGWGSILYLAALASINPELHEAAVVDGANKLQRVWHIDIPGILPTVVIMFILNSGKIMAVGFEKAYLMQTSLNISASEIIATYIPSMLMTEEDNDALSMIETDITSYTEEMRAKWLAYGGIEEEWDAYVERLWRMGLEEYIEIYQRNYTTAYGE